MAAKSTTIDNNQKGLTQGAISTYGQSQVEAPLNSPLKFRKRLAINLGGESRTKQSFKAECDVNNVVKKFKTTGVLPEQRGTPKYGDFSSALTYQDSMNLVLKAQDQFNGLSADVRKRFANDPAEFLAFCENPANSEEMVKLGLATQKRDDSNDAITEKPTITEPKTEEAKKETLP